MFLAGECRIIRLPGFPAISTNHSPSSGKICEWRASVGGRIFIEENDRLARV
jgi:hypothetical protein